MKTYEYQILRYSHDRITGEFVNVGILLFSSPDKFLQFRTIDRFKRLNEFFPDTDGRLIKKLLKRLEILTDQTVERISNELDLDNYNNIEIVSNSILPKDDSALYFSEPMKGLSLDFELTLADLFENIVTKHDKLKDKRSMSDDEVWRGIYKSHFDEKKITNNLVNHSIKTKNDLFDFELCWKNDVWHVFKPISLELVDTSKIKSKIYHYNGLLNELITSEENIFINYLATKPKESKLIELMKEKLLLDESNIKTNIVFEDDADNFTTSLKSKMDSHT